MGLRLIFGRAGSGKSTYCITKMKEILQIDGNKAILLVPEQFTLQAEKRLINLFNTGGILKNEVLSFKRMAHRVFSDVGGITYPRINNAGKSIIISKVIDENKNKFDFFAPIAKHKGFVNKLSSLITEFKRYNVTPAKLKAASTKVDFVKKIDELAFIYDCFQKEIYDSYQDSDDDLTILSEKLPKTNIFDNSYIWIDEFNGFTPQEYKVILQLLERAKEVSISLCSDSINFEENEGADVFSPVKASARQLLKMAKDANVEILPHIDLNTVVLPRFQKSEELSFLEDNYFKYPNKKQKQATCDIDIFTSINVYSEIENVAKEIIKLCREDGYRYKDIAIVARNLDTYEKIVRVIFKSFDIPFFIDKKHEVSNNPLIKLINGLFEIISGNWSYEAVFGYLKTRLTDLKDFELDTLENYCLACGIRGSSWTMAGDWRHSSAIFSDIVDVEYTEEFYIKINEIRRRIVTPILTFCEKAKGKKRPIEICTALYEFLCELGIPDRIESDIEFLKSQGELAMANEYSQVYGIVMELLDQLVEVLDDKGMSIDTFSKILSIGFSEYQTGSIPPSLDRVMVGSVDRTRTDDIRALFIIGVNDGVFPSSSFEEGILSDSDRNFLRKIGLVLADDTTSKAFDEQFLIYRTLSTAREKLKISYPIADLEGRGMRPSIIISRLKKIFPNISHKSNIIESENFNIENICAKTPVFNNLLMEVRKASEKNNIENEWLDVYSWFVKKEEWHNRVSGIFSAINYNNQPETVSSKKVAKLYGVPLNTSISKIEKYSSCPFSYFIQYGLKAKERKIFRISAPDIGNFLHIIIERFSAELGNHGYTWRTFQREWAMGRVRVIVEEILAKMKNSTFNSSMRYISLTRRLSRVVNRVIWIISEHIKRGKFEPIGYEMAFGENGEFPPIKLELEGKTKVILTGRIDRVDMLKKEEGTYIRIIDYKSGAKKFNLSDVFYGLQIQLLTYFDAICENGGKDITKPVLPGGIFYLRLDDPLVKGELEMSEEEIEKSVLKQLKLQGLILADVGLVKDMDGQINGNSIIIPARVNKGDALGKSSAANMERFELLKKYVKKLLKDIAGEMLQGKVEIKPYKKLRETSCRYCKFLSVCQFDPKLHTNNYRVINKKEDDEVFSLMENDIGSNSIISESKVETKVVKE
jgi:ATP-dependent helicase/nuclease subunit B